MPPPETQVTLTLRVLKQSDDPVPSEEVRCLQFMLVFTSGEYSPFERALRPSDGVDGLFGPKTKERVRRFQANENLAVDGIVGRNTWTALLDRWTTFQTAG
jgi:peptidoglycan hydrolase-like protein with peptidoglycan-binding domain